MNHGRLAAELDFVRLLLPLARRWRREADRAVERFGLSHASGWVLLHVGRQGGGAEGIRQGDLAAAVDMRGSSLVPLLDRLESAGLVVRNGQDGDRRVNRITLTPEGKQLVGGIEDALRRIRTTLFDGIGDEMLATSTAVLGRLDRALGALSQVAP
ncbi:MarR family winged helix-turn-helix transcriptional regulator [Sphingomonas nostoxanthinifaciens]|uniref:MarR family winged helix-turn-helix transcriptional regulator n=1 Tax=Sphingomonas nostoxanthinifaciens TaxID=2872652 RepID=UPI001CC1F404|nr:MarR family transcriptional regulator [Sphingomonas nostoxanthinifaciens]UAK23388.1 MarR family transcriptional regulator [Sphingomonas nostoxanthinifaciens]